MDAFAGLRFRGDSLEPKRITALLGVEPTTAYRKGAVYKRSRGHDVVGRTGLWLLSSEGHVESNELCEHLAYLKTIIFAANQDDLPKMLKKLMQEERLTADVSCFWYGERGAKPPVIPDEIRAVFAKIGAAIETDFDTD